MKIKISILDKLLLRDSILITGIIIFIALWLTKSLSETVFRPITSATITIVFHSLKTFGLQIGLIDTVIYDKSGVAYAISYRCTGLLFVTFWCFLVAWIRHIKKMRRLVWMFTGIFILYVCNLVRLVSLFLIGVYAPTFFEITDTVVWGLIRIFIFGILYLSIFTRKSPDYYYDKDQMLRNYLCQEEKVMNMNSNETSKMLCKRLGNIEYFK